MTVQPIWPQGSVTGDRPTGSIPGVALPQALSRLLRRRQQEWFVWTPVAFAAGIAFYFALPLEPSWQVHALVLAVICACVRSAWIGNSVACAVTIAVFLSGFCIAKARTEFVRAPALKASAGVTELAGWVVNASTRGISGGRLVISVDKIASIRRAAYPRRVQITVRRLRKLPPIGSYVTSRVRLYPLMTPVAPGAYDHARTLWFRGIGASGFAMGDLKVSTADKAHGKTQSSSWIADIRGEIATRLKVAMLPDQAGLAAALLIGERGSVPKRIYDDLRTAGLAHILAISGLHMSLVGGGVFWLVRALLAALPRFAATGTIKKWAALAALASAGFYLLVSGAGIATQRSFVMLAIMFTAIIFDRPAISMRNLAVAALIVLLLSPEAVLTPGFQMSFLAVMGLIAVYTAISQWRQERKAATRPDTWPGRLTRALLLAVSAMALTTVVASIFTGLPAAFHFQRIAPFSLPANLAAMPVVTFLVMPAAIMSVVLMPLGLEAQPLWAMGQGIDAVVYIAKEISALEGADVAIAKLSVTAAVLFASSAMLICLARGRARLLCVFPLLAGIALNANGIQPDILIERSGRNVALRNATGHLVPALPRQGRFSVEKWLAAAGDKSEPAEASTRGGWRCDAAACTAKIGGYRIKYLTAKQQHSDICKGADILIAGFPLNGNCRRIKTRIDRIDLWRYGAHAIYLKSDGALTVTAAQARGERPWVIEPVARKTIRLDDFARNLRPKAQ